MIYLSFQEVTPPRLDNPSEPNPPLGISLGVILGIDLKIDFEIDL